MLLYLTLRPTGPMIERRRRGFQALGIGVRHFSFQDADAAPAGSQSYYPAPIPLGRRLRLLARGVFRLRRILPALGSQDAIYVALLDCLVALLIARALCRSRTPVICEIHDVHPQALRRDAIGAIVRAVQRLALSRIALLIVPSRANIDLYYGPVAGYRGASVVVHNAVAGSELPVASPPRAFVGRWRIGWFCGLRCRRSLEIVRAAATALGEKVEFVLAGELAGEISAETLRDAIQDLPNVSYLGRYRPDDLAPLYGRVDLAFVLHFEPPDKSVWALATRIFEAGAHGCPSLARAGTEMGRFVTEHKIGWALEEPCEETLVRFLERLTPEGYGEMVHAVRRQDVTLFSADAQLAAALEMVVPIRDLRDGEGREAGRQARPT